MRRVTAVGHDRAMPSATAVTIEHCAQFWGPPLTTFDMANTPIGDVAPEFRVVIFERPGALVYLTQGMTAFDDPDRLEVFVLSRPVDIWRFDVGFALAALAHFHRTGARVSMGHTVNLGLPIVRGATCDHALLSLPYLDGPDLEWCAAPRVRHLWLIPITQAEREFKIANGLEALEERFEAARVDYLDWGRPSIVGDT